MKNIAINEGDEKKEEPLLQTSMDSDQLLEYEMQQLAKKGKTMKLSNDF